MVVEPVSPYDELVDLFARAVELRSEDKFLFLIFGLCQQIAQETPEKTQ